MTVEELRKEYPLLEREVYGKKLVYLDNAATSQKPRCVLDFQNDLLTSSNANIHRAIHCISAEMTDAYEAGRESVRSFINASSPEEVIFTGGTTSSLNLLATCFSQNFLKPGDKVLVSRAEHHSNIVPWQMACERVGATLEAIELDSNGCIDVSRFESTLDRRVKIVSVTHVSNVLGIINPIKEIVSIAHSHNIPVAVDGAQGCVHSKVDVRAMDCDFYAFSGHKLYAPSGIGVLYGKKEWLDAMPPYMGGGEMIEKVTFEKTTYAPLPLKYEAGTPNYIAAACMKPALEFALGIADDVVLRGNEYKMTRFLMEKLPEIDGLKIYGTPVDSSRKIPVVSFAVEGAYATDIAMILDKMGIAVRSGHMCAEPLLTSLGQTSLLRASLLPYNTLEECCYFVECVRKAVAMLR